MRIIPILVLVASLCAFGDSSLPIFLIENGGGTPGDFKPGATNAVLETAIRYTDALADNLITIFQNKHSFANGLRVIADDVIIPPNSPVQALQNDLVIVTNFYSNSDLNISVDLTSPTPDLVGASVVETADRYFVLRFNFPDPDTPVDFFLILSCSKTNADPDSSLVSKPFHFTHLSSPAK